MGGDGGSIPGRSDVVKTAGMRFARNLGGMGYLPNTQVRAGSEKYVGNEARKIRWRTCALTQEQLRSPIVGCRLGQLYNKEAVLKALMNRKTTPLPDHMQHITGLKSVKTLNVRIDPETHCLICPVTQVEFDGGTKGVFFWKCGCVVSKKAFERLMQTTSQCPNCETAIDSPTEVVSVAPEDAELIKLKQLLRISEKIQPPECASEERKAKRLCAPIPEAIKNAGPSSE